MCDNKIPAVPKDSSRVDLDNPDEVLYWIRRFCCSRGQLVMAVAKAGESATAVEEELKKRA
jgi:hypothetical protein